MRTYIILATVLALASCQQPPVGCPKGCAFCSYPQSTPGLGQQPPMPKCFGCFGNMILTQGQCISVGSYNYAQCYTWEQQQDGTQVCRMCNPGFALSSSGICIPHKFGTQCVYARVMGPIDPTEVTTDLGLGQQPPMPQLKVNCYACAGSWPNMDYQGCQSRETETLSQQVNPCIWGFKAPPSDNLGQQPPVQQCLRCMRGYAVNPTTMTCVQTQLNGCRMLNKDLNGCLRCDIYGGFYQQTPTSCGLM